MFSVFESINSLWLKKKPKLSTTTKRPKIAHLKSINQFWYLHRYYWSEIDLKASGYCDSMLFENIKKRKSTTFLFLGIFFDQKKFVLNLEVFFAVIKFHWKFIENLKKKLKASKRYRKRLRKIVSPKVLFTLRTN